MYFDFYSFSGRKRVERFRSEVIKVGKAQKVCQIALRIPELPSMWKPNQSLRSLAAFFDILSNQSNWVKSRLNSENPKRE